MKRSEKEQIIAEVTEQAARAKCLYFADFTGITVEETNDLRREFRKAKIDYRVVKNTLIRKALQNATGFDTVLDKLVGPTVVAFGYDDPVAPAKIIKKFREKNQKLSLKICVLEKQVFPGSQLDEIAKLPTRPEIIASILGSIEAPIAGIPGVINAVMRDLVSVIDAIEKKQAA